MNVDNNKEQISMRNYISWIIASLFYGYIVIIRTLPVVAANDILEIFNVSEKMFGQMRGLYFIGYCAMHLPVAYFLDKFGPRKIISLSILLTILGVLPMVMSNTALILTMGRVLLGIGSAGAILGVIKINRMLFPDEYFSRLFGISVFIGLSAGILGMGPLAYLYKFLGYFNATNFILAIGVILGLGAFFIIPRYTHPTRTENFFVEVKELLLNKKFLILSFCAGLMISSIEGFVDGWSTLFLSSVYGMTSEAAININTIIMFGFAIGCILLGFVADITKRHRQIFGLSGLIMAICYILVFFTKLPDFLIYVDYFIIGIFSGYQVLFIYLAGCSVPNHLKTISGAGANMISMSFGYLFHTILGLLMEGKGKFNITLSSMVYPTDDLLWTLSILPITCLIAYFIINWTKIKLTHR